MMNDGKSVTMLLVDDDPAHAEAVRRAFDAAGLNGSVQVAGTLREYRKLVAARPPEIAIIDLNLPDGRALEVLSSPPEAGAFPVVVMTSYGNPRVAVEAMKAGALDCVVKSPEAFEGLPRTVERALREWALLQEHKRAEEALRENAARYDQLAEQSGTIAWEVDAQGLYTYVSHVSEAVLGYRPDELAGRMHFYDLHPEVGRAAFKTAGFAVLERKEAFQNLVNAVERKDGRLVWLSTDGIPLLHADGTLRGYRGSDTDITGRKRAEEALRESVEKFRGMAEQLVDVLFLTDSEGIVTYVSPSTSRMLGWTPEEIVGRHIIEFLPHEEIPKAMSNLQAMVVSGQPSQNLALTMKRKDGSALYTELNASVVRKDGAVVGTIGLIRDISERRVLEAQLRQAQKMESIGRLAGGVAHDFNNLLTVINGYSQLLLGKLNAADPLRAGLTEIHKAGERAAGLTRQLLAFSRKQVLQPRGLNVNRVVEEMRPMLERLVGEAVEVRVALNAESGVVRADPHQLEQVVMNLVVNARDAMPGGGKLLIETAGVERDESYARLHLEARAGRYVMLAVSDNGVGMDEETRQRIFEPFFTTKGVGQGTGLGLSMVQGIVAQSGGYIDAYSEPGQGTTFKIYLPRVTEAVTDEGMPEAVPALGGKETVLVVEDQAQVRDYTVAVLKEYGYRVIQAENASEALLFCERERERVDLVLTDVVMPNVSGRELANRLEKLRPGIKVLFMSGYTDNAVMHHGVLEKSAEFIQKPFSPEELAGKVRAVLGSPTPFARIVVADDEAGVRGFLRAVLEQGGYEVIEAVNGKQAVEETLARRVDLVITDLVMPEQEGIETIRALRRDMPGIGIIAISGAFQGQFLKTAQLLGADAVLNKPVSAGLLLASVDKVLKLRR